MRCSEILNLSARDIKLN